MWPPRLNRQEVAWRAGAQGFCLVDWWPLVSCWGFWGIWSHRLRGGLWIPETLIPVDPM